MRVIFIFAVLLLAGLNVCMLALVNIMEVAQKIEHYEKKARKGCQTNSAFG